MSVMRATLTGRRAITWVLTGLAVVVLVVSLACVGRALAFVIFWSAPGLAVVVAVGVVGLAVRMFPRHPRSQSR